MADKIELEAPITEVTVFQGKALIMREGKVEVGVGEQDVHLGSLPLSMDEESVRVSGEGLEGSMITGVDLDRKYDVEALDVERRRLEREYKDALEKVSLIEEEVNEVNRQLSHLDNATETFQSDFPRALAYKKADLEDHKRFMEYVVAQRKELLIKLRERNKALERARDAAKAAKGFLDQTASKAAKESNEATIGVKAKKAGPMKLTVTYMVYDANWEPLYDTRVMTDDNKINMTYYGIVTQSTGEDWNDVDLILSTASHTGTRELPELSPWYLSTYRPEPARRSRGAMMKREVAKAGLLMPQSAPMGGAAADMPCEAMAEEEGVDRFQQMEVAQAEVQETGEAIVFKVANKDTVPSDGQPKKLTVGILDLDCKTEYLAIPKLTQDVFLKAKAKNETDYIFLPGKVNLFQEDDFIGSTMIQTVSPKEKFELSLGVARRVKAKRELKKKDTESAGLLKGSRKVTYAYEIELQNLKQVKSKFIVMDQLPVPEHEDIKIEDILMDPKPKEVNDLKIIKWKVYLEPQKKQTISLQFAVQYPTKITVFGLPE